MKIAEQFAEDHGVVVRLTGDDAQTLWRRIEERIPCADEHARMSPTASLLGDVMRFRQSLTRKATPANRPAEGEQLALP